jgi:hypothetical protein
MIRGLILFLGALAPIPPIPSTGSGTGWALAIIVVMGSYLIAFTVAAGIGED